MNIQTDTVVNIIKANYHDIFSAEKKVADYILRNPEAAVNFNVSELAKHSHVSDGTVIRFCKHIGYEGYYQLRICLSRDLGRQQVSEENIIEVTKGTVGGLFNKYANNLIEIGNANKKETLESAAKLLKECNHVHIVAVGNTTILANYLGFRLGRLGIKATYNSVPAYFLNQVNLAEPNDIVFAISKSGSSTQVIDAVKLAKEKKLKVISITGYQYSPVSKLSNVLLLSNVETTFNYYRDYSQLGEMAVIEALISFTLDFEVIKKQSADKPEIIAAYTKL